MVDLVLIINEDLRSEFLQPSTTTTEFKSLNGVLDRQKIGEGLTQQFVRHVLQKNIGKHLAYFCWIFFFLSLTLNSLFCI